MKLEPISNNCSLLRTNHGWQILYSYGTAVAGYNPVLNMCFKTDKKWSNTTTRHINKWLTSQQADNVVILEQSDIDNIGFLIGAQS